MEFELALLARHLEAPRDASRSMEQALEAYTKRAWTMFTEEGSLPLTMIGVKKSGACVEMKSELCNDTQMKAFKKLAPKILLNTGHKRIIAMGEVWSSPDLNLRPRDSEQRTGALMVTVSEGEARIGVVIHYKRDLETGKATRTETIRM